MTITNRDRISKALDLLEAGLAPFVACGIRVETIRAVRARAP